jgi:hypothetical protein
MLKDNQRIIRDGRTVIADYQHLSGSTNGIVEITIYEDGKLMYDQVFVIPFKKLRQVYEDYREGNKNEYVNSGSLNEGIELKYGKRLRINLKPREIYNIIMEGERVKRKLSKNEEI